MQLVVPSVVAGLPAQVLYCACATVISRIQPCDQVAFRASLRWLSPVKPQHGDSRK